MIARRCAAATALAVAALSVPALAQAAPVVPSQAVLAANEFPAGSFDYKVFRDTFPAAGSAEAGTSPCGIATRELERMLAGVSVVEAEAWRGSTLFYSVVGRPVKDLQSKQTGACLPSTQAVRQQIPVDLARVNLTVTRSGSQRIEGSADVRGVTVGVVGSAPDGKTLDTDTFWQVLRAQIAKVERQP